MDLAVSQGEICLRDGEDCGSTFSTPNTSCCGALKCVMVVPHPIPCLVSKPCTFKCLDCNNELCGGPNNIKCCPVYECDRTDDKASFGKCVPIP